MKRTIKSATIIGVSALLLTSCGTSSETSTPIEVAPTVAVVTAPWWPDGFSELDENTAAKINDESCGYVACFNYDVISKVSCPDFYVEVTFYDDSEANLGYSNDVATAVEPMQVVKMQFDVYVDNVTQGAITKVSCY
jgi:hypothetical protein